MTVQAWLQLLIARIWVLLAQESRQFALLSVLLLPWTELALALPGARSLGVLR